MDDFDYDDFSDQDYIMHHAAFQHDIRCLDPDAPLTHNLLGNEEGNRVLELAINEVDQSDCESLRQAFETELQIPCQTQADIKVENPSEIWLLNLKEILSKFDDYFIWQAIPFLVLIWQIISDTIINFIEGSFFKLILLVSIKFLFGCTKKKQNSNVQNDPVEANNILKSCFDSAEAGKQILMKAFQAGKSKVVEVDSKSIIDVNAASIGSGSSVSSKAFVQGTLQRFRPPKCPPSVMSESDLVVPVAAKRVYMDVNFNGVLTVNALLDPGATSCSINRSILNQIEKALGFKVPRLKRIFHVTAFAHSKPKEQECAVLDVYVNDQVMTRNVPFLINEIDAKVVALLGINVLKYWGLDFSLGHERSLFSFKNSVTPSSNITPSVDRNALDLVVTKDVTLYPLEAKTISAKIHGTLHPSFGNELLYSPEFGSESGLMSTSFLFKKRGDRVNLSIENISSDTPITLTADTPIGNVSVFNSETFTPDKSIFALSQKQHFFKTLPTIETACYCNLRTDRTVPMIIFCDKYGISPHFHQMTAGDKPLKAYGEMKAYRIDDRHIICIKPNSKGTYPFIWSDLQKYIKSEVRCVLSFRQQLSTQQKTFIEQLTRQNVFTTLYKVKNTACTGCGSLANRDCPELFTNIDGYKVFIINGGTQVPDFQRTKDSDSPEVQMFLGYYCTIQCYRSQGKLIIFVHVNDWHVPLHRFRMENIIYTLFAHLRILGVPQSGTVLTSWDDMACEDSRQIIQALKKVDTWETNPQFKIEHLKAKPVLASFVLDRCGCRSCVAITSGKRCPVVKAVMVCSGDIKDLFQTSRVKERSVERDEEELGIKLLELYERVAVSALEKLDSSKNPDLDKTCESEELNETSEDKSSGQSDDKSDSTHPDDRPDWHGQEEVKQALNQFPGELDADSILRDRHVPKPWRLSLDESKFSRLDPKVRKLLIQILDRFNDMFSHHKGSWRYMKVDPLDLEFIHDTPIVSRPYSMSPIKDRILTAKIMNLIEHDLVKIIQHDPKFVTNILNLFLVPHNSECKREEMVGKHDPNKVQDIDPSKFRAVVDLREANATIRNPTQLNYVMESTTELLNRMAPFRSFILMDISSAYRSYPVTEKTCRRFCFRANTEALRSKVLAFSSLTDGISVAPSVFSHKIMQILEPIQKNCLVWIDDVLLMADNHVECLQIFQKALELLEAANVLINIKKLVLLEDTFDYLGFKVTVTPDGPKLSVPESRKEVFSRMAIPKNRDEIRKILGMCTFVDLMIPGLHCHMGPLIDELKLSIPTSSKSVMKFTDVQTRSFDKLKKLLDHIPSVFLFRYDQTAYLVTDASLTAAGACLFQLNPDGSRRIIAYYSKRFPNLVSCQKSSIFKEILALFFGINHFFKPYLIGAVKTVLICDLSCMISLLSASHLPSDQQISRLSFKLFSFGFSFQLRHAPANKDILISDQLSRLLGEPISFTGLPIGQMKDAKEFFENYKEKIPSEWKNGAEFSYQDMISHLTSEILKDPKISENVRQKRFNSLLQNIDEQFHPPILQIVKNGRDTNVLNSKTMKGKDIEVSVLECKGPERYVDIKSNQTSSNKLSPPRAVKALNIAHIVRMQREDPQCANVIYHLLTVPFEKQDKKWRKHFRVLDSNLLVTRKSFKKPWDDVANLRIYLPIPAAMYVMSYMHLVSAHIGQNFLAQMFSATYRCFQMTKLVKICLKSCSHCQIYEHKGFKYVRPGRLPRATRPAERCYMDILKIPPGKLDNKTYTYVLGLLDDFSGFLTLIPLKNQQTESILTELGKHWSTHPPPSVILTDNATYFVTPKFREKCMSLGVGKILTTSPNHSTSNSRIERSFKTVRRILFLNLSTFRRQSHWDVFYSSLAQFNNTPSWRLAKYSQSRQPASPMELYYSQPCEGDILSEYLGHLSQFQQSRYKDIYQKIIKEYDQDLQKAHDLEIENLKVEHQIVPGDIVMVMNPKRIHHENEAKGKELYLRDLWEVIEINKSKATLSPLFFKSRKCERVFIDHLKKYEPQMLVQFLPEEIQALMGHYHNPEVLKRTRRPPSIVENRMPLRNFPSLRNRVDPEDKISIPAIKGPFESDDLDDIDDDNPLFPTPGPGFTQIRYGVRENLVIPDDPNLAPQGPDNRNLQEHLNLDDDGNEGQLEDLNGDIAVPDLEHGNVHPGNREGAQDAPLPETNAQQPVPRAEAANVPPQKDLWEIPDHQVQPESPGTVMGRLNATENAGVPTGLTNAPHLRPARFNPEGVVSQDSRFGSHSHLAPKTPPGKGRGRGTPIPGRGRGRGRGMTNSGPNLIPGAPLSILKRQPHPDFPSDQPPTIKNNLTWAPNSELLMWRDDPPWDLHDSSSRNLEQRKEGVLAKAFGSVKNWLGGEQKGFKDVAKSGQKNLQPFQPKHESSPRKPTFQYVEPNIWNQISPVGRKQLWKQMSPEEREVQTLQNTLRDMDAEIEQKKRLVKDLTLEKANRSWGLTPDTSRGLGVSSDSTLRETPQSSPDSSFRTPVQSPKYREPSSGSPAYGTPKSSPFTPNYSSPNDLGAVPKLRRPNTPLNDDLDESFLKQFQKVGVSPNPVTPQKQTSPQKSSQRQPTPQSHQQQRVPQNQNRETLGVSQRGRQRYKTQRYTPG